jgi:cysteine-rich repeat protein
MNEEIAAIQDRINQDFADVLNRAGVDWQLILLSRHGKIGHRLNDCDDNGICIGGELTAGELAPGQPIQPCDPLKAPADTAKFHHYSICIDSQDGLQKIAASFASPAPGWSGGFQESRYYAKTWVNLKTAPDEGWSAWLRPGALRAFLMVSDDSQAGATAPSSFQQWLYAQDPSFFGTPDSPNWVFHSIVGLAEKAGATPYTANEPLVTARCGSADRAGQPYQQLSRQSGGLRFPVCQHDNFDAVFQGVAKSVVDASKIPCTLVPAETGAGAPDFDRTVVVYESGDERTSLARAPGSGCKTGDYYVTADDNVQLCPATCSTVEKDAKAKLSLRVACIPTCGDGVREGDEECDDGNLDPDDECSAQCRVVNDCGNGRLDSGEECDSTDANCSANCTVERGCGDGDIDAGEECDDDNVASGDGCSATCQLETGCGNGKREAGEACDDDNRKDGDGCDSKCNIEVQII